MSSDSKLDPFDPETVKAGQAILEEAIKTHTRWVWCPVQKKMVLPKDRHVGSGKFEYVMFPVEELANLAKRTRAPSLTLLIWIMYRWFSGGRRNPFPLPRGEIKGLKLSRQRKYKYLKPLVEAGLISVQRRPGKCHLVTILWKPRKP
jgi:hypothetical protein